MFTSILGLWPKLVHLTNNIGESKRKTRERAKYRGGYDIWVKRIFLLIKVVLASGCKISISCLYQSLYIFKRGIEDPGAEERCMSSDLRNVDVATGVVPLG